MRFCLALGLLLVMTSGSWAEVAAPVGFRLDHYRAALPDHLDGAETVDTERAAQAVAQGAVAIDVTPLTLGRFGALKGRWVVEAEHETIDGAWWLPNVGLGELSPEMESWFRHWLDRLSQSHPHQPLLFFCRPDCWMAWNAAKRAHLWGYGPILWYPAGTDGWRQHLLPVRTGVPEPLG